LARQLAQALDQAKLDAVAAKDPGNPGQYVAALYIAGFQLLVVQAKYASPPLFDERLAKKDYREAYIELNSAGDRATRVFIEDLGADGLKERREDNKPFDAIDRPDKRLQFDNDWRKQQVTEEEYRKRFAAADEDYAKMLTALLAGLKGT
jgi:hypothetical protein